MRIFIPFVVLAALFMTGCTEDEPKDVVKDIMVSVSEETGVAYDLFDDKREHPIECMLIMTEDNPGAWEPLGFGGIEGFTYERGHAYYLRVKRTILANPPQDGSDRTYSLVSILEDRLIAEPEVPVEKEITSEADIEYYDLCPVGKYAIDSLFTLDANNKIGGTDAAFGGMTMSYDSKRIYLINILDKGDSNWVKFQSIPYMAIYSYVISPLTDEIRLVRNESSGPMFKNVIPGNEFESIVRTLKSGDELHYTLILANVYRQGLQKLEFTVKKQ